MKKIWLSYFLLVLLVWGCSKDPINPPDYPTDTKEWFRPVPTAVRQVYVAPQGQGNGVSPDKPTNLVAAIASSQPGDHIWLMQGEYAGSFDLTGDGTPQDPIIFRNYQGQRATVIGGLHIKGRHNWVWGLEMTDPQGLTLDLETGSTIFINAEGTVLINNVLHPEGYTMGIAAWDYPDHLIYGNIIYRGHHNIYTQNDDNRGLKWFVNNMSIDASRNAENNNGPYEFHAYAEGGQLSGFRLKGNVFANSTISGRTVEGTMLMGGKNNTPNKNIVLEDNWFYNCDMMVGYRRPVQSIVKGNYVVDAQFIYEKIWGDGEERFPNIPPIIVQDNSFIWHRMEDPHVRLHTSAYKKDPLTGEFERIDGELPLRPIDMWDRNTYSPSFIGELRAGGVDLGHNITSLEQWRHYTALAGNLFDKNSKEMPLPTAPKVVVQPNHYEEGRAHVIVYNFTRDGFVQVDLSGAVKNGTRIEIHRYDDMYGTPVYSGTYSGGSVTLPVPNGSSDIIFSAYVVRSVS